MGSNIPFSGSGQKLNAPFNPIQISGCQLWLDAADKSSYTLSGTNVTSWADKSGTRKTLTFSGTPTYKANATGNLPAIVFSSAMLTTTFSSTFGSGDVAYFAVWIQYTNSSTILMSLGGTTTPGLGMGCNGQYNFFEWGVAGAESDYAFTGSISFNKYVVQSGTIRSNSMLCSVNGYSGSAATSSQAQTSTTFNIGSATSVGSGYAINGEIAELLVYVGTISTGQQEQIEGYLAWKWGISLNPSHTYASVNQNTPLYPNVVYSYLPYAQSSPEFTPLLLSGCICWLDGADPNGTGTPPTNGTTLTTWKDKSISNFSFTSGGSAYNTTALNGLPGINIGTNFIGYDPGSAQNNWQEVFAVGIWTGGSTFTNYNGFVTTSVDSDGGSGGGIIFIGNVGTTDWYPIGNTYTTPFTNGTQSYTALPAASSPFQVRTSSPSAVNLRGLRFGVDRSNGRPWIGFISEVICYNITLTTTQRYQVEAYLAKKWKLVSVLNRQNIYAPGSYLSFATVPIMPAIPMRLAIQNNRFFPNQLTNCVLWLDAADVNGTGRNPNTATITSWTDKSGAGNNSTASGGTVSLIANALNNKPGVSFSAASSSYIQVPRVITNDWSIFILFTTTQTGPNCTPTPGPGQSHTDIVANHWWGGQGIFDGEVGGIQNDFGISLCGSPTAYLGYGGGDLTANSDTTEFSSTPVNTGAGFFGEFFRTQSTGNLQMYVNGAFQVSTTGGTSAKQSPNLKIGSIQTTPAGYYFTGNIYEIVCYTRVLTVNERQSVEGYFAWKWGLRNSLPNDHPFKLIAPLPIP